MKNLLYLVGGASLAALAMVLKFRDAKKAVPVGELAHRLQDAWVDHHMVA